MNIKTRRLLAVTVTTALVSAPVLVAGGAAHADTPPAGSSARLGLTDLLGGVLGTSPTSTALPNPLDLLANTIVQVTSTITGSTAPTDPTQLITSLATGLTGALTSGDPTQVLTGLTSQLTSFGFDPTDVTDLLGTLSPADLTSIAAGLLGALPVTDLFGGAIPQPIADLLGQTSTPNPATTDELIAAMTAYYKSQNKTADQAKNDAAAKALPPSALAALLAALSKKPVTAPKPTPSTGPSAACTSATKKVTKLTKQVRIAKHKHQKAKAKRLAKKLAHARIAKIRAC